MPHAKVKRPGQGAVRDPNAAMRAAQALELAVAGHTYQEIAEACGYTQRSHAHRVVQNELRRMLAPNTEQYRKLITRRLEALYKSVHPIATDNTHKSHLWAVDRAIVINAQLAKLHGLEVVPPKELQAAVMPTIREYPEGLVEAV